MPDETKITTGMTVTETVTETEIDIETEGIDIVIGRLYIVMYLWR